MLDRPNAIRNQLTMDESWMKIRSESSKSLVGKTKSTFHFGQVNFFRRISRFKQF